MTDDLVARMKTCAAYIASRPHDAPLPTEHLLDDAVALLTAGADCIEKLTPIPGSEPNRRSEPMEIIEPQRLVETSPVDVQWVGPSDRLPQPRPKTCPKCGSVAHKKVYATEHGIELQCPVCGHGWLLKK